MGDGRGAARHPAHRRLPYAKGLSQRPAGAGGRGGGEAGPAGGERQAIAEFQPLRQYIDTILSSTGAIATTQIAADYDISAKQLNKILHEEGLQHCVNGQWILYRRHMGKGYTKSETIPITRSDGRTDTRIYTKWTQKGRILIHEILTRRGILAVMDRQTAG